MALAGLSGSVAAQMNIEITDVNYNEPNIIINKPVNQSYGFGTGAGQVDIAYSAELTIAPSATTSLDLNVGTLKDIFGNALTFSEVKSIRIQHKSDSAASNINLQGDYMTTNFGASFSIAYPPGGYFDISESNAGFAVVGTTGDVIDLVNNDGSNSAIVSVELLGVGVFDPAPDFFSFYEFGDGGLGFLVDTAGNQNLVNSIAPASTQFTDPVQGEVAAMVDGAGFTNMGWVTGNVDKSFTMLVYLDFIFSTAWIHDSVSGSLIEIDTTQFNIFNGIDFLQFTTSTSTVNTWIGLGLSITSDFKYRMFKNGSESSTGQLTGTQTLELDSIFDLFGSPAGRVGKGRTYSRILTPTEFSAIDAFDRKT